MALKLLKEKLKNKKIWYAIRCIHNYRNEAFCKAVLEIGSNNHMVSLSNNGNYNEGIPIYYIYFEQMGNGFFAEFRKLLNALYFADIHGLIPVVEYAKTFPYTEENGFNKIDNPYEYFYKQPRNISIQEMKTSSTVLHYREENRLVAEALKGENGYEITAAYEDAMSMIIKKYIVYADHVQKQLDDDTQLIGSGSGVLGVHVRGTDFKQTYARHPNYITIQEYIEHTQKMLKENQQFHSIFLATDDTNAVDEFRKIFGDKVLFYKGVKRSTGNESVMLSDDIREYHKYQLGYEVIRDMHSLALCDGLVAGMSQVSIVARITKKSMEQSYEVLDIIDKGIAVKGKKYITSYKKAVKNKAR